MRGVMYRHYASSVLKFYSDMRMLREIGHPIKLCR